MSRPATMDENKAIFRISQSSDGKHLINLLHARLEDYDKSSRRMTGDLLLIANGKRQELEILLDIIYNAMTNANAGEKK